MPPSVPTAMPSPPRYARLTGFLYLYIIAAGLFAEIAVRSRLVSGSSAEATARNVAGNELLFRIGFTGELLHLACDVAIAAFLYSLLRPVDRTIALVAAFMRVASAVVLATASLGHFAALRFFSEAAYLKAIPASELQALGLLSLRLHADGYAIALVFFGVACLALGLLIHRSTFLPRILGAMMGVAGACYLVNSFAVFLAPRFAASLSPGILVPAFVAELSLALWLALRGVDATAWTAKVATMGSDPN